MHARKFPERLPTGCHYLIELFLLHLSVQWGLALAQHQRASDFVREGGSGVPLLFHPSTSARVQNRFEFVELAGDMSSNCTGEVQAETGISRWYQLVPRTHYISTRI